MSGIEKQRVYYWDSCIYLAWLQKETVHGQAHLDAIAQISQDNSDRKNIIITSVIVYIEVLSAKIGQENEQLFRKSFRSQCHIPYDVDPAIALRAREFRENLLKTPKGRHLSTPDAIHLATATIYKADEMWTFDAGKKGKNLGLLGFNKDSRIGGLAICKPSVTQGVLFDLPTHNKIPD